MKNYRKVVLRWKAAKSKIEQLKSLVNPIVYHGSMWLVGKSLRKPETENTLFFDGHFSEILEKSFSLNSWATIWTISPI